MARKAITFLLLMFSSAALADKELVIVTDGEKMSAAIADINAAHEGILLFCLLDTRDPDQITCLFELPSGEVVPGVLHKATKT